MDTLITLFLLVLVIVMGIMLFVVLQRISELKKGTAVDLIKTDVVELGRSIQQLSTTMSDKLDRSSQTVHGSMQKQLSESAKLVADVTQRLAKLDETNRRVVDVADELKTLQNVLSNPKQRGVFGEFYLESVLENVLPATQFKMQYKFKDGEIADAVIFLDKGNILPVDSKFSLENYNRMIEASGKEREQYLLKVKNDLKLRIDETSKYIRTSEKTMDFAFMFIPSESLYYDLLINNVGTGGSSRDLIEYAFRDKRVIIVSPTSFMAYLQTVLQGLRSLQIEEQAKDIQVRVGKLGQHLSKYSEFLNKLGVSLSTTVNHYNNAHKEFVKVDKDIVKIAGGEPTEKPLQIDKPRQE
ncbi:MAG TPA: DNA recombination protein RmuC [Candidatus Saccharibacteria bacterium]|nr:DNA recombination protein RmuC [Candidatus Saccharibacteria bacterium]HMR38438.1 DNA recombination protein RmuC [Candidatus Saccharibacteria bacterium]